MTLKTQLDPYATGGLLEAGRPLAEASLAILLLHGRGGSAEDMLQLGAALELSEAALLAPQADTHSWYPSSFLAPRAQNEPSLSSALDRVANIVASIAKAGVDQRRIVIAGFSQGACLATQFVASHPARYGALLCFTGGLIGPPGSISPYANAAHPTPLAGMPALLSNGDPDPYIPWSRVEESAVHLQAMGAQVLLKRFPGRPHTVSPEELELARTLLRAVPS